METMKYFNDKKEELALILFASFAVKNEKLKSVSEIYQNYVDGKLKFPYSKKEIFDAARFIKENNYFHNIGIPLLKENNHMIVDDGIMITPGENVKTLEEYNLLVKFLIATSNNINSGKEKNILLINEDAKKAYINSKIDNLFEVYAKKLFDSFVKCYRKLCIEKENILTYYNLFEAYFDDATCDKYNDLMSKMHFLQSLEDKEVKEEIRSFIKEYNSFIKESKKPKKQVVQEVLVSREERMKNYESKKDAITYMDADSITLTLKQQEELNEIFDFVYNLDKEDFKEFASNPLSFFSHIDESYRPVIINKFINMMDETHDFKMKKTIAKRLEKKK